MAMNGMNERTQQAAAEKKKDGRWADLPDYQVEWLDYDYVTECDDTSQLRDIYTILQSGKEGRYPHLEQFVEKRLLEILPAREKKLWVAQRTEPTFEDRSSAAFDLDSWADNVSKMDQQLTKNSNNVAAGASEPVSNQSSRPIDTGDIFGDSVPAEPTTKTMLSKGKSNLPPVRNQNNSNGSDSKTNDTGNDSDDDSNVPIVQEIDPSSEAAIRARNEKKRRYGFEYFKEWDKFDPEVELKRMEELEEKEAAEVRKKIQKYEEIVKQRELGRLKEIRELGLRDDKEEMSEETRVYVAEREKRKGNECFRAKEFDEAYLYYSRSIYFDNTQHVTFANRAMVCIRLKKYDQAESDCTQSLMLDSTYTKAISRRGMARHKQGKYMEAIEDFELALKSKPHSKELKELLNKSKKMFSEVGGIRSDGTVVAPVEPKKKKFNRIQIVEVDSSDEEEEDEDEDEDEEEADASTASFISSKTFDGKKTGYVFQNGASGIGYYRDSMNKQKPKQKMTRITIQEDSSDEEEEEEENVAISTHNTNTNNRHEQKEDVEEKTDSDEDKEGATSSGSKQQDRVQHPSAIKAAATSAFKAGDLPLALQLFGNANDGFEQLNDLSLNKERVKCMNNMALCGQQLGNNQLVVDVCTQVLLLDKDNVKALLRRGIAYEEVSNFSGALDDMCTIMRIDPSQKSVADSMERLLSYISGTATPPEKNTMVVPAAAVAAVAPAAPAAPAAAVVPPTPPTPPTESAEELKQEGNALFKAQKYDQAIALYEQAFGADSTNVAILGNLAMAHLKLNQYKQVVQHCTQGLELLQSISNTSLQVKLLYRRATALHKMGGESLVQALHDFQTVVSMEPSNNKAVEGVESVQASIGLYQAVKANTPVTNTSSNNSSTPSTPSTLPEKTNAANRSAPTTKTTNSPVVNAAVEQAKARVQIPSTPPKTSFEIEKVRRECIHDLAAWGKYLSSIKPKSIKKIFGSSLSEDMLSSIIHGIASYFIPGKPKKALSFMKHLSKVNRFGTNLMFLSDSDKRVLVTIFVSLSSSNVNQETLKTVRKAYQV
jgi:tetratricopeptide (TPR) repeat protein